MREALFSLWPISNLFSSQFWLSFLKLSMKRGAVFISLLFFVDGNYALQIYRWCLKVSFDRGSRDPEELDDVSS